MLSCKETSRLLSESRERPLPLGTRIGLKLHLMMCRICRQTVRQIAAIEAAARAFARRAEKSPPESLGSLGPEARARIRSALRDEA
jgi:hypothetical protein